MLYWVKRFASWYIFECFFLFLKEFCFLWNIFWFKLLFVYVTQFLKELVFWYLGFYSFRFLYIKPSIRCVIAKNIFPLCRLLLCVKCCVFCQADFQFHEVQFINCWSSCLCHWCSVQKVVFFANAFKDIAHIFFYQFPCVGFDFEVFDLVEFSAPW